ncbi:non-homologous end joining protein Ku [Streptomyces acidicola]|uniref:non-homologous end joining protein Ku n=1 Tax=Streptomyces acidicola TaxID=2596892 RepID=UPI0038276FBB
MPAIWSGAISFGLVTIPIRVVSATETHSISFHQYHREDMGRVRYRKICEVDGQVLTEEEIGKGYEWGKDQIIAVTDDELDNMPLPTAKAVEIVAFVPYETIDPIRIGSGYYLEPSSPVAAKPYVLLRKALERSSKAAVAKFALRGRERLGLLRIREDAIVLHALHWDDEIRDPSSLAPPAVELSDDEIDEAMQLVDIWARDGLDELELSDRYTEALERVIEAKVAGQQLPEMPEPEARPTGVVDLMLALEESVAKAKEARGEVKPKKPAKKATARRKRSA